MVSKWFHFHVSFHVHLETWEPISKVEIHIVEHFKHESLARETGQPLLMFSTLNKIVLYTWQSEGPFFWTQALTNINR